MKKHLTLIALLMVCRVSLAQTISGVINSYAKVTSIAGTTVNVLSATGFNIGDNVLIIQMKGASITNSNTSTYGDIVNYNDAGNWEFTTISDIVGTVVTIAAPLTKTYNPNNGRVQLVTVPYYCNVTLTDTLTCKTWNDSTGGVLVFQSGGLVTMNADINVSGKGFQQKPACNSGTLFCNNTNWFLNATTCIGAYKGFGIADPQGSGQTGGRAKIANGGGGSNRGNGGGAGGGNYGAGGTGGNEDLSCGATGIQAVGGLALNYTLGKMFMGGSGGNGHGNNGQPIFGGTPGGGIVIISANTIEPNGHFIYAEGRDQSSITIDEGAGGGGAGGTVCLDAISINSPLGIFATGGDGGSVDEALVTTSCQGPGGGGGGGALWVKGIAFPANVTFTSTGGLPGTVVAAASTCFNTANGATAGADGAVIFNFPPLAVIPPPYPVSLGPDFDICPLGSDTLFTGPNYISWLWQDGSTDSIFLAADSGFFFVKVSDTSGCFSADTIHIGFLPPYTYSMGNDTTVCAGQTVVFDAGNFVSFLWQDGSMLQTFSTTTPGTYSVAAVDTNGCTGLSTIKLTNFGVPPLDIGNDTSICIGGQVIFVAGAFASYLWQDGSIGPTYIADQPGTYIVIVEDFNGCIHSDTAEIPDFYPQPPVIFLEDTIICPGQILLLEAPEGYTSYLWSDSSTTSAINVLEAGVYSVTIENEFTCKSTDSSIVTQKCPTDIYIPTAFTPNGDGVNDEYMCIGYNVQYFYLRVFNRWGKMVFQTTDITKGWNGSSEGIKCEMGTYTYIITWTGAQDGIFSSGLEKGNLTLIR
jgi:gliding motility-associated-like protein